MLRFGRPLYAARCHYTILGVPQNASADEIKSAFRERAKQTHPDAGARGTTQFPDLVEAYRVLRDEKKRRQYDIDRHNSGKSTQGTSSGPHNRSNVRDKTGEQSMSNPAEFVAIAVVFLGGVFAFSQHFGRKGGFKEDELQSHPRKLPTNQATKTSAAPDYGGTARAIAAQKNISEAGGFNVSGAEMAVSESAEDLIRAFYDPFFERWYKIPEGYEAPSGMDLTSWHNKRTDSVEWSRLHATGKLSQIIPRGGLQVRYLPSWQTYEPMIVQDPFTRKTVLAEVARLRRPAKEECSVQF